MRGKASHIRSLLCVLFLVVVPCAVATGKVVYVDAAAVGANDGSSWADAYNYLQDALADANLAEAPVEIHVAQGLYTPDQGAQMTRGDRCATFRLLNGTAIQGGYGGLGEPDPDARDVDLYRSILSGDLNGDDVEVEELRDLYSNGTRRENSRRLVTGSYTDETAVLDGFTITAGRFSPGGCGDYLMGGAGMGTESGSPMLIDCSFVGNGAFSRASAMANSSGSNPTLINCTFSGNHPAAMENIESSPTLAHCTFSGNSREGMFNRDNCRPVLTDCTFEHNEKGIESISNCNVELTNCTFEAHLRNGIDHSFGGRLSLTGCVFRSNTGSPGGGIDCNADELILNHCSFVGNVVSGWGAVDFAGDNARLYNCEFRENTAGSAGGLRAHGGEVIIENCTFSGNVADRGNGGAMRLSMRRAVISNCIFAGNLAAENGGAIEAFFSDYVTIRNCTFSSNSASGTGGALYARGGTKASNCIFWGNSSPVVDFRHDEPLISYSNVEGGWPGEGNIDVDPGFAEPGCWELNGTPDDANDDSWTEGDYGLLSQAGRRGRDSQTWVKDNMTSPCIDAGDPNSPIGTEPFPNGGRINMGAYGAGETASKSYFGEPLCETIVAGDINGDCVVDFDDLSIIVSHWMMQGNDFVNKPPTVRLIEPQDGDRIAWPGPTIFRAEAVDVDGEVDEVAFRLECGSRGRGLIDSNGTNGWQRDYTWPGDITDCTWTVWVQATDNEGQLSVSPRITVTLYRP